MFHVSKTICAVAAAAFLAGAPAISAERLSPVGSWELSTGKSRYSITECGDQGEICAKLVWLREDAKTAQNLPYLNTYVVKGATPSRENKWTGTVFYEGESIGGSVTMLNGNSMRLTGCKLIACTSLELTRI